MFVQVYIDVSSGIDRYSFKLRGNSLRNKLMVGYASMMFVQV
jgi:hypothetical protein